MRAVVAATICPLEFLVTPPSIEEKLREKPNQGLKVSSVSQKGQYFWLFEPALKLVDPLDHLLLGRRLDRSLVEPPHLQQAGLDRTISFQLSYFQNIFGALYLFIEFCTDTVLFVKLRQNVPFLQFF